MRNTYNVWEQGHQKKLGPVNDGGILEYEKTGKWEESTKILGKAALIKSRCLKWTGQVRRGGEDTLLNQVLNEQIRRIRLLGKPRLWLPISDLKDMEKLGSNKEDIQRWQNVGEAMKTLVVWIGTD